MRTLHGGTVHYELLRGRRELRRDGAVGVEGLRRECRGVGFPGAALQQVCRRGKVGSVELHLACAALRHQHLHSM